jgi:alpha-tubulin suppressor-like RCC1 family protein
LYSWGTGANGRLGHGDEDDQRIPKKVEFFRKMKVVDIAAGHEHSLVCVERFEEEEDEDDVK